MQLIFDHIIATVISVTVLMALLSTQLRVQQTGIEQVSAHAAKTKALSLGTWLEDDITSLGANFGNNLMRFETPTQNADGVTTEWVFYSDSLGSGGVVTRHLTRYRVTAVDTLEQEGQLRPLYRLDRQTASTPVLLNIPVPITESAWKQDGRSVATLSQFRIAMVERFGNETSNAEQADYIRVEFSMVPEFERHRGYLQELYWSTLLKVRPFWQAPQDTSA